MTVKNMFKLPWTAHTEYLLQELQKHITNHIRVIMPDHVWDTIMRVEIDEADPDNSSILEDITTQVIVIHIEATLDHNTGIDTATTGAVHDDLVHIADHPNIKVLQVINPRIIVDHIHDHPIAIQDMNLANQIHIPAGQEEDHVPRRIWRWRLKIHTLIITAPMITPVTQEMTQTL